MKNILLAGVAAVLFLWSPELSAQSTQSQPAQKQPVKATSVDRGSQGAITMEEYETLLKQYQEKNPGKTFQNMKKEEFETYLTTELAKLRKTRAEEALQKETQQKEAQQKAAQQKEAQQKENPQQTAEPK